MPITLASSGSQYAIGSQSYLFPSAITNLTATPYSPSQIQVTWSGNEGKSFKYTYQLYNTTSSSTVSTSSYSLSETNPTLITFSTPDASSNYSVTVTASSAVGTTSATSNSASVLKPPSAITNVTASSVTTSGFTLTWSGGVSAGPATASFTVAGTATVPTTLSLDSQTATFTGLSSASSWTVNMTIQNLAGSVTGNTTAVYITPVTPQLQFSFTTDTTSSTYTNSTSNQGGNLFQTVLIKNKITGTYCGELFTAGSYNSPMPVTSPYFSAMVNALPVNPVTNSRGIILGNIGSQYGTVTDVSLQTALSAFSATGSANYNTLLLVNRGYNTPATYDALDISIIGFTYAFWIFSGLSPQGLFLTVAYANLSKNSIQLQHYSNTTGGVYQIYDNDPTNNKKTSTRPPGSGVTTMFLGSANFQIAGGTWQHYAVTVDPQGDPTNATMCTYFNGQLYGTSTGVAYNTVTNPSNSVQMLIGGLINGGFRPCNGMVGFDDFRYYPSVLTANQINAIYRGAL